MITAAQLYDHVACPHRVHLDLFGDPNARDEISPFVQLLWERGSAYEAHVIGQLKDGEYLSLRKLSPADREAATLSAMDEGLPLIHGGRIVLKHRTQETAHVLDHHGTRFERFYEVESYREEVSFIALAQLLAGYRKWRAGQPSRQKIYALEAGHIPSREFA